MKPSSRMVALGGGRNFRDLGGYPSADGRTVRWNRIFRAGSPVALTDADWESLRSTGICAVCDLRTSREREREPFAWSESEGLSYWARDYQASFAELRETMNSGFATGDAAKAGMMAGYRELPFEQAPAYRKLFAFLKGGHLPVLVNCTAGKDRTGMAAALVLTALGVPRSIVVEDYVLTNEILRAEGVMVSRPGGRMSQLPREVVDAIGAADPDYINAALDAIDARHGSVGAYLNDEIGVSPADLHAIRDSLLEPS